MEAMDAPLAPYLYVIAGPNGTGKTTFAETFLPHFAGCGRFVNADWIAKGLSAFEPETVAFRAGRLMLEEIRRLRSEHVSFAFETTLSGKTYLAFIRESRRVGYSVHLIYLWPGTVATTLARIAQRVRLGGHDIPEADVHRRFLRTLQNLFQHYMAAVDSWTIIDNSAGKLVKIAYEMGSQREILVPEAYASLEQMSIGHDSAEG
jgi:predicted ABC-type ATPase